MAAWQTSSLAFSDHNKMRNGHGLLKNLPTRISKQHIVEHKMFGSKRGKTGKDIKIGKKFHRGMSSKLTGDIKSEGISPSIAEFDKMMSSVIGKSGKKSSGFTKKPSFSRKSFG
jgi:hypothetical protein